MKVLLFTHRIDIDGMGSVVLSKLAFYEIDYCTPDYPKKKLITMERLNTILNNYFINKNITLNDFTQLPASFYPE